MRRNWGVYRSRFVEPLRIRAGVQFWRENVPALQRAAKMARETAIQTGTDLIIVEDGKLTRISAEELRAQARAILAGEEPPAPAVYPHQIAFNLLPQIDSFAENGYTKEELKMLNEGRKILSLPELKVTCTCVRVPVYRSHSISVTAQFEQPVDVETARRAYDGKPGVAVMDNPSEGVWPTPLDSTNGDTCYVGRMRIDMAIDNALTLWVVGDQVRKGAALNAVQIAELLVNR